MLAKLKAKIDKEAKEAGLSGKVNVSVTERGLVISINNAVFFDPGDAYIKPSIMPVFRRMMATLSDMPNHIRIEGHTDNTPISTERYPSNWELSTSRATNVVRYLISAGVVSPKRLSAAGYAEYSPKVPNDTEAHRAQNRRVDVVVIRNSLMIQEP
jgi:chemotaxis protein MotB